MPLLQGYQYLGPGNPLRKGDPVDEDDGIAKSHDEAYERATSHEDVFAADQASAALFLNDFTRTGRPIDVVSYTTSNLSNYESYEQKRDLNVTMRLRPDDMHTRHKNLAAWGTETDVVETATFEQTDLGETTVAQTAVPRYTNG
ncbi:hypothetical protein HPB51_025148 [Rhipicephalus microplus]|uniref:Phospholipase A2-like domain-containing protein n=1 Tax=Rhipicephalus microplus TaxID=6941 RepID=A0A9J6EDL1_RHIMP|nr:hypothetical protein HPB51_025148 [Rhipicephalus microplus]